MSNISFEFFPPNTPEGAVKLRAVTQQLGALSPEFFSVTYGAGGSTREKTLSTVLEIIDAGFQAAPHLSCIGATKLSIAETLALYKEKGIRRIVALRGDMPSGMGAMGDFNYATDLVKFIRELHGDHFTIEVAAYPEYHPQSRYAEADLANFVTKANAGAHSAITQFFFNGDAYFHFVDEVRKRGVTVPIVPGIMPFHNFSKIARFAAKDLIDIPRWITLKMEGYMDDAASIRAFGADVITQLCQRLLDGGAPGIHFYTMNQAPLTAEIVQRLRT
ncbi:MAG: methylenetetrahydrofolate reductase [NAD(P)H] [Rhizobacter sp.]|nr:methylenetetrahydrofolate reductase [NAD(P)H] [Burkholderiales bacterium]